LLFGLLFIYAVKYMSTYKSPGMHSSNVAYGVNVDMTAMIPGTPYTVTTASGGNFFDLAAQLGINTLRITDSLWESTGEEYSQATWRYVFDEAEHHHVHVILLLIDSEQHTAIQQAHTLLGDYGLAQSPALWLVDLYNEPNLSDPQLMAALRKEAAYVHQIAPAVPITIGGWKTSIPGTTDYSWQRPQDLSYIIDLVDIVAYHNYGYTQAYKHGISPQTFAHQSLAAVRQYAKGKPIIIEEFGGTNGLAPVGNADSSNGTLQSQAAIYQGVLQEVAAEGSQGVIGAIGWIFSPRPTDSSLGGDMTGWSLVLNNGLRILPAANSFAAYSKPSSRV
jgi:endo-1,4-beta-mannosidase